jgi:hypothetical protein
VQTGDSGFEQRVAVRACAHECASMEVCAKSGPVRQGRAKAGTGFPGIRSARSAVATMNEDFSVWTVACRVN